MKSRRIGVRLVRVTRYLKGERLDRIAAAGLLVLGQIEFWAGGHTIAGHKGLNAFLVVLMPACVAVRRRWPFAVGVVVMFANSAFWLAGGKSTSLALGVSWMCA